MVLTACVVRSRTKRYKIKASKKGIRMMDGARGMVNVKRGWTDGSKVNVDGFLAWELCQMCKGSVVPWVAWVAWVLGGWVTAWLRARQRAHAKEPRNQGPKVNDG